MDKSKSTSTLSRRAVLRGSAAIAIGALATPRLIRQAAAEAPKLKTVEEGYITVAMTGDMPTTGYADGKFTGSDCEMIMAIADKLGLKPKPAIMDWSATIQSIRSGRADIMCGDMSWTTDRAQALLLTNAIYYEINSITMKKSVNASNPFDLNEIGGHTVGTGTGFYGVPDLKKIPGVKEVRLYDTTDACFRDVAAGRIDFASLDSMDVDYRLRQDQSLDLKQIPIKASDDYPNLSGKGLAVFGMSLDNPDLFDAFNSGVAWLWKSGKTAEIVKANGLTAPEYLVPPTTDPRIGIDRDDKGNIVGPGAHAPKDFSSLFA